MPPARVESVVPKATWALLVLLCLSGCFQESSGLAVSNRTQDEVRVHVTVEILSGESFVSKINETFTLPPSVLVERGLGTRGRHEYRVTAETSGGLQNETELNDSFHVLFVTVLPRAIDISPAY